MTSTERKKATVITKYILESFAANDWYELGQITGKLDLITEHPRLLRALGFGDDDYGHCVAEVLNNILSSDSSLIDEIVNHFDMDLWYQQKDPAKFQRVFSDTRSISADFWREGFLKLFISHLTSNKDKMSVLKSALGNWGVSAFVAHEDIEASREWLNEVEIGLQTMEILVAVVEPGFRESDWCAQEVGYALGRNVDIIPLKAGMDPFGFFGKFQGVQIKGKFPEEVAYEIVRLLLKKPKYRNRLLECMSRAFSTLSSTLKIKLIGVLDSWSVVTDDQTKSLLETSSMSDYERIKLKDLVGRVGAFKVHQNAEIWDDDEIPF
ncbi:TIR domain-containing protein [Luteolibacter ambystomatis]|uniref:TIR domain-containing protein n=1 Tax=Luteolibacter ambystomatis TaxID=2824561 RepID=A0A975PFR5_9BACT|nr:TIR domain-containing protein [Luteolibacter ambystomatis]QUE52045.1 TIR domain-containing protein [Luteolibacter ambystomatis]